MSTLSRAALALVVCLQGGCSGGEPRATASPPPPAPPPSPVASAPPPPTTAHEATAPAAKPASPAAAAPGREQASADPARAQAAAASARARRAAVQEKVAARGVLGALGTQGAGGSLEDVLGGAAKGTGGSLEGALGGAGKGAPSAGGSLGMGSKARAVPAGPREQWPELQGIPVPTTRKFLGRVPEGLRTLGEVARYITAALDEHQYEEIGYFRYSDGFAIATRPERISGDAKPVADRRWPAARMRAGGATQSLQDLFEVNGEEGERYRSFVFLCQAGGSDVGLNGGAQQTWGLWKTGSANPEGDPLLAQGVRGHKLFAFVYELSQEKGGRVLVSSASLNTATQHLRAAGLATFLR